MSFYCSLTVARRVPTSPLTRSARSSATLCAPRSKAEEEPVAAAAAEEKEEAPAAEEEKDEDVVG